MPPQRRNVLLVQGGQYRTLAFSTAPSIRTPLSFITGPLTHLALLTLLQTSHFLGPLLFPKSKTTLKSGGFISKEGETAFLPFEIDQGGNDEDPVEHVREDSAQGGRIVYEKLRGGLWLVICMYGVRRRENLLQPKMALKICQPPLVVAEPVYMKDISTHTLLKVVKDL